jgi:mRNA-degrading endonuclease RelE of RelBE toxin-antitoxin system
MRTFDRRRFVTALEVLLTHGPTKETRNLKRLRPNDLAEWELRVGAFRVFYDVVADDEIVKVVTVGWKRGNNLLIHGEEYAL